MAMESEMVPWYFARLSFCCCHEPVSVFGYWCCDDSSCFLLSGVQFSVFDSRDDFGSRRRVTYLVLILCFFL